MAINTVIEEVIRDLSFNAKVLPELPEDMEFYVEENNRKRKKTTFTGVLKQQTC